MSIVDAANQQAESELLVMHAELERLETGIKQCDEALSREESEFK